MLRILFILPNGQRLSVEAETGLSVMEVATRHDVPGIQSDCGGALSCGTCHALISPASAARVPPPSDAERAMFDHLVDPQPNSRLTCQIVMTDELDGLEFTVPPSPF